MGLNKVRTTKVVSKRVFDDVGSVDRGLRVIKRPKNSA